MTTYNLWVKEEDKGDPFLVDLKDTDVVDLLKKAIATKLRDGYTGPTHDIELDFQTASSTTVEVNAIVYDIPDLTNDNNENNPLTFRLPFSKG